MSLRGRDNSFNHYSFRKVVLQIGFAPYRDPSGRVYINAANWCAGVAYHFTADRTITRISSPLFTPTLANTPSPTAAPIQTPPPTDTLVPCPPFAIETELPDPDVPEKYIGLHFDHLALPKGLIDFGGFLIQGPPDYGLTSVQKINGEKMYWLERFICHGARGKAYFEVRDVLPVPHLIRNQVMASVCSVDGAENPLIIAVGTYQKDQAPAPFRDTYGWTLSEVDFAWRVDIQAEKFVPVPQENLVCVKVVDWSFRPTATPAK